MEQVTQAVPAQPGARLSGIDALRAVAMLLGVLFHSLIAYRVQPLPAWPFDDSFHHWGFDFIYLFIHSFRMPLFFLIAGYFCRLLLYKTGEKAFISHRIKRIVIPFALSLVVILPFTIFPFLVFKYSPANGGDWSTTLSRAWKQLFRWNGMAHLWFLYYLIFYYVAAIMGARIRRSGFATVAINRVTGFLRHHSTMTITGLLVTWLVLCGSDELYLHVDTGILPGPVFLGFYFIFFVMGWLLHKMPAPFGWYVKHMTAFLITGVVLSVVLFLIEFYGNYPTAGWKWAGTKLLAAIQILSLVYGIIGFFLRYFASAGDRWRYISDASFWMYLVHLGLIAALQVLFIYYGLIPVLRFPLVLGITFALSLISYRYMVRYTKIGEYLHGKREKKEKNLIKTIPKSGDLRT